MGAIIFQLGFTLLTRKRKVRNYKQKYFCNLKVKIHKKNKANVNKDMSKLKIKTPEAPAGSVSWASNSRFWLRP